ncbi:hypothetical protein AVEN_225410-1 [Araneus ventricosus]|uniref:Uncharacterized protein n=1 Tax=Araneus ventricosus TaxID=182803 RepID=A0A4Y2WT53_ARAVE|nr:hypothetical protein AVEN_225410-1 [Araneus ventricosus]
MVLIRLQFFLDKNNLLPEEQFGFRRGHSTIDQVLYFAQTFRDAQNLRPTHHSVAALLDLMKAFDRVWNLSTASNKKDCVPDFLKQLALEIINSIPLNDIKIYTDGSKTDKQAGSGICIETPCDKYSIEQRNPDFCSVFQSELLAIDVGLETIMSESNFGDLWILTDSHSSIQHLKNWTYIGDKTSLSIL